MVAPLVPVAAAAANPTLWPWYAGMAAAGVGALTTGLAGIQQGWGRQQRRPVLPESVRTGRNTPPNQLRERSRSAYGLTTPSLETGRNVPPSQLSSNTRAQYGLTGPAPGSSWAPMETPAARTERARRVEMLGNAGVQTPLPPLEDLKPYWDRPENQAMRTAATPGKEGFVAPGGQAHSDRADMMAWLEANKNAQAGVDGRNIVDRYLLKEYNRGTLGEQGLAMARARGLVKDGVPDYSGAFGRNQGYSPADAYGGKFDLPEFASAGSEDVKQWPQNAVAPEQIAEMYKGGMDLDPRSIPNAVPDQAFTAPMKADLGQLYSPQNRQEDPFVQPYAPAQQGQGLAAALSAQSQAAAMAGYGSEHVAFPGKDFSPNAFNTGMTMGDSFSNPSVNRDVALTENQAQANSFLDARKRNLITQLAFQGGFQR